MLTLGTAPALAATINVGGECSLVEAITTANLDIAFGGCTDGSGADTIILPAGSTHTLTAIYDSQTYGPTGLPVITSAITIAGNHSTIARSQVTGTPDFRLLTVSGTGDLTLHGLALAGGALEGSIGGNAGAGVLNRGTLTLINSSVRGNSAASGSGVFNNGTVTLANSSVSGNTASDNGGGIFSNGTVVLTNSAISDNTAGDNGGGVFTNGPLTLTSSSISGNTASLAGGGGVASNTLTLINSTVAGNTAGARDGGVGTSNLTIARTLVSGNTAPAGSEIRATSTVASDGFNLFGHSGLSSAQAFAGFTPGAIDIIATSDGNRSTALASIINPTLANNGGLTQTHALVLGSPAIDAVSTGCPPPNRDQRGVPRPQDGNNDTVALCDIGAFERVRPGTVTCDGLPATIIGKAGNDILTGTPGRDLIQGRGGNDVIRGLGGNDVICDGPGNDRVFGGPSNDRLFGGAGIDRLNGDFGFDRCDFDDVPSVSVVGCERVFAAPPP